MGSLKIAQWYTQWDHQNKRRHVPTHIPTGTTSALVYVLAHLLHFNPVRVPSQQPEVVFSVTFGFILLTSGSDVVHKVSSAAGPVRGNASVSTNEGSAPPHWASLLVCRPTNGIAETAGQWSHHNITTIH